MKDYGSDNPELLLMASGSEVHITISAAEELSLRGIKTRVISFPCWELFEEQDIAYQESVIPSHINKRLAIEAGSSFGWERWVGSGGRIIGIDRYGASAPGKILMEKFNFTVENIIQTALELLRSEHL